MAEILALIAIVLAIATMNRSRKSTAQLAEEIHKLRGELEAAKAGLPMPSETAAAVVGTQEAAGVASGELQAPAASSPVRGGQPVASTLAGEQGEPVAAGAGGSLREDAVARQGAAAMDGATAAQSVPHEGSLPADVVARESLESRIGARWAVWVGGLALALGGIFMVRYAIESGLLSPAVRLTLAALFGLLLVAAGELVRRRTQPAIGEAFRNAMVPGVLTAAGALTLFGVTYAAHGVYGYFGTPTAFLLLAVIALATVALSLLHGQALAGLGLLGSMITPLLVSVAEPDPWRLFGYLSLAWLATLVASRLRRWQAVPTLANAGLGLWATLYVGAAEPLETLPVTLALFVMLAGLAVVWPGAAPDQVPPSTAAVAPGTATDQALTEAAAGDAVRIDHDAGVGALDPDGSGRRHVAFWRARWKETLVPASAAIALSAAVATVLPAILLAILHPLPPSAAVGFVALMLALAALGAARCWASSPAILGGLCALSGTMVLAGFSTDLVLNALVPVQNSGFDGALPGPAGSAASLVHLFFLLALGLAAAGMAALWLWRERAPDYAALWSLLAAFFPVAIAAVSFAALGNLSVDWKHGLFTLACGLAYLAAAEVYSRALRRGAGSAVPQWALVSGAFGFLVLSIFALTDGVVTTLLVAGLGLAMVFATRVRNWPVLPWMMAAAAVVVAIRIAWEPTIVGAANLSKTPLFNQLLAGYGGPAVMLAIAAYELRAWPGQRARNLLQALASLFALLTLAILVRHAMTGGVLDSAVPTLGEQSIYTLLAIGASAVLMTLDLRSPSAAFGYGSIIVGSLSMISILSAHFFALNPYFSGELTGRWPFFNLLLIGYLLPGLAYAGLAWYARGRRPALFVSLLGLSGAIMAFAWVSLSVRRYWHGENIASWKGFLQGETYTYSVVWLLLGVGLLALGSRLEARSVRLASAALVLIAVVKVFLFDMANLEGILRALSFIGLGAVLIGIGLFYQKLLSGSADNSASARPRLFLRRP
ncbi:DUF2339 domain-containing protein [Mycoplana dimorpha]|uniref:Putative membrane protein n=1 Tax=Mycoplana dimorpha TaxID=28320 RepID=A0A2T5BID6_MYCDI|nr:DUF2339 domain-containing protein [Mycoplana dimorpha]PTM98742.1 putative membrane protein [Mycoplana dimorpha]